MMSMWAGSLGIFDMILSDDLFLFQIFEAQAGLDFEIPSVVLQAIV